MLIITQRVLRIESNRNEIGIEQESNNIKENKRKEKEKKKKE